MQSPPAIFQIALTDSPRTVLGWFAKRLVIYLAAAVAGGLVFAIGATIYVSFWPAPPANVVPMNAPSIGVPDPVIDEVPSIRFHVVPEDKSLMASQPRSRETMASAFVTLNSEKRSERLSLGVRYLVGIPVVDSRNQLVGRVEDVLIGINGETKGFVIHLQCRACADGPVAIPTKDVSLHYSRDPSPADGFNSRGGSLLRIGMSADRLQDFPAFK